MMVSRRLSFHQHHRVLWSGDGGNQLLAMYFFFLSRQGYRLQSRIMPAYKISALNRAKRVLVVGNKLTDVIERGRIKLDLPDGLYKLVLDDDGTEIDDDELLQEICGSQITSLMLLRNDEEWDDGSAMTSTKKPNNVAAPVVSEQSTVAVERIIGENLWNRFPKRLLNCCKKELPALAMDRRSMVSIIVDYMIDELKDVSRTTAGRIAEFITKKFPATFQDTIGDDVIGNGSEVLRTQIYNAVNYKKILNYSKKSIIGSDDSETDEPSQANKSINRKRDGYGCIEYQPLLPEGESATSQDEKRKILQTLYEIRHLPKFNEERVKELMTATYPAQRTVINAQQRDISKIFRDWPWLKEYQYFIDHATRLLGKCIQEPWDGWIQKKGPAALSVFTTILKRRERKRKSNSDTPNSNDSVVNHGLEMIAEAKKATSTERSITSKTKVVFRLIVNHFKEDDDLIFTLKPGTADLHNIEEESTNRNNIRDNVSPYPILVIKGQSFYDDNSEFFISIENCLIRATSLSNGLLGLISAYYVFGFVYQEKICKALEFFQRVLLQINPKTGHKRHGKQRKMVSFDPQVYKLSKEIDSRYSEN